MLLFFCLFADRDKFLLFLHLPHSVPPPSQFHYISRFLPSPPTHKHKPARQPSVCTDSLLRWAWGNTSLDMDTVILRGTCRFFMSRICSSEEPTEHICLTVFWRKSVAKERIQRETSWACHNSHDHIQFSWTNANEQHTFLFFFTFCTMNTKECEKWRLQCCTG